MKRVAAKVAMYKAVRTWPRPPPPTSWVPVALSSELATVAVEHGYADEGGNLAAIQFAQLGLFGAKHTGQNRTHTRHAPQQGVQLLPSRLAMSWLARGAPS